MTDWRRPQCQLEANLLAYWLIGVTEEIKKPLQPQGLWVVRLGPQVTSVPQQLPLNTRPGTPIHNIYRRAPAHPDCLALMLVR